jgi:hypothetical protein
MFEHNQALLPKELFLQRFGKYLLLAGSAVMVALAIGVLGYHFVAQFTWIDSLLNAAMILTGIGPVGQLTTTKAKLFASAYALFSGVVFLSSIGIFIAPLFHRLLHRFHLEGQKYNKQ